MDTDECENREEGRNRGVEGCPGWVAGRQAGRQAPFEVGGSCRTAPRSTSL